jgi:hypothetical protein
MSKEKPTFEEHVYGREWRGGRYPLNFHFFENTYSGDLRENQKVGETSKLSEKDIEQWLVWEHGIVVGRAKNR